MKTQAELYQSLLGVADEVKAGALQVSNGEYSVARAHLSVAKQALDALLNMPVQNWPAE